MHCHMENDIFIVSKVTVPHTQYRECDMFMPRETLAAGHIGKKCAGRVEEKNYHRIATNAFQVDTGKEF